VVEAGVVVDTVIRSNWWWATNFLMSTLGSKDQVYCELDLFDWVAKIRFCNTYLYNENWF
jgi:hypothetical protein